MCECVTCDDMAAFNSITELVAVLKAEVAREKKQQGKETAQETVVASCLVIGQGGGADAHGAYALAKALAYNGLCAEDAAFYATVKVRRCKLDTELKELGFQRCSTLESEKHDETAYQDLVSVSTCAAGALL